MKKLFLNKELVNELTQDGTLAYIGLRSIMQNDTNVDCVSMNRLAFSLIGEKEYEKALIDALIRGIDELAEGKWISIRKDFGSKTGREYVLDLSNLYLDTEKTNFIIIDYKETYEILACKEIMKKKIGMLKYFVSLVGTFDMSSSLKCLDNMPNLQGKVGHMSQQYISEQAGNSIRTCQRYNEILEELKIIYVYKSNDKIRDGEKLRQIKNCYSRYIDKDVCEAYASNYENIYGYNHKIIMTKKSKEKADSNRRLGAIYNQLCWGNVDYDSDTIRAVYNYITNVNKSLQEEIDKKYNQEYYKTKGSLTKSDQNWVEYLESKIRPITVFDQFDFIGNPKVSNDYWGSSSIFYEKDGDDCMTVYSYKNPVDVYGSWEVEENKDNKIMLTREEAEELFA